MLPLWFLAFCVVGFATIGGDEGIMQGSFGPVL
jgi:hypothetical protein